MLRKVIVMAIFSSLPLISLSQKPNGRPVPVVVEPVSAKDVSDRIEALGTLRANESVALTVNVAEIVTAIHFNDGQRVKLGDLLVEMTSEEEHALLDEARSNLNEAEVQYERVKQLALKGTASVSLLDQRRRDFESARARLVATQSRLQDRIVTTPFDGVLGLRQISAGALVSPGDIITTLVDDSVMKLDFQVPAIFLSSLKPGLAVLASSPAFAQETFSGNVVSVDNQVDPVTRAVRVRARIPNEDRKLKQGMLMTVDLLINKRKTLLIDEAALVPEGEKNSVLVAVENDNNRLAEKRQIRIGARYYGEVEILQGLEEGELVITHGSLKARPGSLVKLVSSPIKAEPNDH